MKHCLRKLRQKKQVQGKVICKGNVEYFCSFLSRLTIFICLLLSIQVSPFLSLPFTNYFFHIAFLGDVRWLLSKGKKGWKKKVNVRIVNFVGPDCVGMCVCLGLVPVNGNSSVYVCLYPCEFVYTYFTCVMSGWLCCLGEDVCSFHVPFAAEHVEGKRGYFTNESVLNARVSIFACAWLCACSCVCLLWGKEGGREERQATVYPPPFTFHQH